jgi:hypothetical protein
LKDWGRNSSRRSDSSVQELKERDSSSINGGSMQEGSMQNMCAGSGHTALFE